MATWAVPNDCLYFSAIWPSHSRPDLIYALPVRAPNLASNRFVFWSEVGLRHSNRTQA